MARKSAELCSSQCQIFREFYRIAPHAEISDGEFAITNVGDISLLDYFKNIGTAKNAKNQSSKFLYTSAQEVFIENADGLALTIDMDGEFIGYAPVKIHLSPRKITFFEVKLFFSFSFIIGIGRIFLDLNVLFLM